MPQYIYYQGKQYPVPIQYSLPKGISSVEAGLLIDGTLEDEDIFSLLYEWNNKGIIIIKAQDKRIKIEKCKGLPDDAKKYEKYIYNGLFSEDKINSMHARVLIMDYCFKKGWIKDFWPTLKATLYGCIMCIVLIFFGLYAICFITFLLLFFLGKFGLIFIFTVMAPFIFFVLISIFSNLITSRKYKTIKIERTRLGTQILSELLGYKKYLKQIKLLSNHTDNESIQVQYGTASDNIVLKIDKKYYTMKQIKNQLMQSKIKEISYLNDILSSEKEL